MIKAPHDVAERRVWGLLRSPNLSLGEAMVGRIVATVSGLRPLLRVVDAWRILQGVSLQLAG